MKVFDFDEARKMGQTPEKLEWIKQNKDKKVSEEDFILAMQELKKELGKTGRTYTPHSLKYRYKKLKKDFGFFIGK
jgi:BRCT domain type II-containing protein